MFDEMPEDKQESYPCPECESGIVTQQGFARAYNEAAKEHHGNMHD